MPGIGLGELIVIAVIALILFDPKDLPSLFFKIGRFWKNLNEQKESFVSQLRELNSQLPDVTDLSNHLPESEQKQPKLLSSSNQDPTNH